MQVHFVIKYMTDMNCLTICTESVVDHDECCRSIVNYRNPYHWLQENYDLKTTFGTNRIRGIESAIDHFTVVCLVTWRLNGNEAKGDLVLIQTSLLFLCKLSCFNAN